MSDYCSLCLHVLVLVHSSVFSFFWSVFFTCTAFSSSPTWLPVFSIWATKKLHIAATACRWQKERRGSVPNCRQNDFQGGPETQPHTQDGGLVSAPPCKLYHRRPGFRSLQLSLGFRTIFFLWRCSLSSSISLFPSVFLCFFIFLIVSLVVSLVPASTCQPLCLSLNTFKTYKWGL